MWCDSVTIVKRYQPRHTEEECVNSETEPMILPIWLLSPPPPIRLLLSMRDCFYQSSATFSKWKRRRRVKKNPECNDEMKRMKVLNNCERRAKWELRWGNVNLDPMVTWSTLHQRAPSGIGRFLHHSTPVWYLVSLSTADVLTLATGTFPPCNRPLGRATTRSAAHLHNIRLRFDN